MKHHALLFVATILIFSLLSSSVSALDRSMYVPDGSVTDVSWPNCKEQTELQESQGIIGVTGGLDFVPNKCLRLEAGRFPNSTLALYANTGYPGLTATKKYANFPKQCDNQNYLCLAYNYGYSASQYAIQYADSQSVHSNMWWLDVETENSWSNNALQNRAALTGMVDGIEQANPFAVVGFYSYPGQWNAITDNWHNNYPAWVATGGDKKRDAVSYCHGQDFTGNTVWLSQYTPKLDVDYACD